MPCFFASLPIAIFVNEGSITESDIGPGFERHDAPSATLTISDATQSGTAHAAKNGGDKTWCRSSATSSLPSRLHQASL